MVCWWRQDQRTRHSSPTSRASVWSKGQLIPNSLLNWSTCRRWKRRVQRSLLRNNWSRSLFNYWRQQWIGWKIRRWKRIQQHQSTYLPTYLHFTDFSFSLLLLIPLMSEWDTWPLHQQQALTADGSLSLVWEQRQGSGRDKRRKRMRKGGGGVLEARSNPPVTLHWFHLFICLLSLLFEITRFYRWISPVLLLIDLYEQTCVTLGRRAIIKHKYHGYTREWKWFDDRLGKWCNYGVPNHKSIDEAYEAGEGSIRCV